MTIDRPAELARAYESARPRLIRVAYAVLGSTSDAEDVVSDGWLRLITADARDYILDVEAWATVTVARLALDLLKSARVRRERYVGPWLPEPIVETTTDPADRVTLDESVSYALMVVLETLSPAERTTWVLHDLFGLPFDEVAAIVGRSPAAVRQLAARARQHVADNAPRVQVTASEHDAAVAAFLSASAGGDLAGLLRVLDPEVLLTSDGGGQVHAARRPVLGADRVGRFILGIAGNVREGQRLEPVSVNGATGLALYDGDELSIVVSFTVRNARIVRLDFVLAPDKLPH
ncbi:MAG: polymerase sigma factor SigJ [Frankiales bacterium]|jgi:RNA polymerase sigma-70 factor (ECF subfamily)|nr:polymerase sigma factor SigJ [Frankiales bacterium]